MTDTPAATSISRNITLASNGGGIDVAAQSQSLSWSGNISGNGGLFKTGAGTLVLIGNNTYTGGTQVAGGTLWVASDAKLGAAGTHVDLNNGALRASETFTSARPVGLLGAGGAILVDANKSLTLSGVVRGSGSLTKTGDGTLILTGANAYTGSTTVNAGVLQGNTMSLLGHITNNASVVLDQAANGTYAGNITGLGSLTKIGAGTLILPAAANYAGGTTVSAGALQGTTFSLQGNILNNAAVIFDQGFDGTYAGNMTGTGTLTKNGPGTLTLTGTSSVDGGMTVNAGALLANGSIASSRGLRVNTRATVGGTGILPSTIINGGTLSPGNSIGTINIIGNLAFGAGSVYAVEVSGSAADRANVTGSADLSGGTVDVTFLAGGSVSRNYTILNATGGLGGTKFAGLSDAPLPGFKTSLSYDANNVYLVTGTDRTDPELSALNRNQRTVADRALEHFEANGRLPAEFVRLDANGLSAASGEIAAGAIMAGIDSADRFLAVFDGQGEGGPQPVGTEGAASGAAAYAEDDKAAGEGSFAALDMSASHAADPVEAVLARRWSTWGAAYGGSEQTGGDPFVGSHDTNARTFGLVGGVSHRFDETLVSIALGGGWSNFSLADGLGEGDAGTFNAGIYGRQGFGNAYLSGALAYGFNAVETNRTVLGDTLTGKFDAHTFSGRAEAGYRFETPVVAISPYAAFQAISYHLPAYSETSSGAGPFALHYDSDTSTATRVELGTRLDHAIALEDGARLTLSGRAAWAINGGTDRNFGAGFQALPASSFTIDGAEPDRNALLIDAGAQYTSPSGVFAAAAFQGEFSGNVKNYSGKLKLGITW
ncbi:autotransporter domain-containing protein [Mesorhizobium sp. ORM16]|uniref:autotransporter outer membrane beta-barrel domain-containing protein n=1 Tax=Mesorhizobium sp. ORM16 TaxID=3376989 RepID=UPI0038576049